MSTEARTTGPAEPTANGQETMAPMLGSPRHVVGHRDPHFSPARLFALSRVGRDGVGADEGCWLMEQPLDTVHPNGIRLGGESYSHPQLMGLIGSVSVGKQPALVMRYDGALLARGVLDEVVVLERLAGGELVERLRCRPTTQMSREIDLTEVLRARRAYERELVAMRALHEAEYLDLASGQAALEQLRADQRARRRQQRGPVQPVRPATPEFADARPGGPTVGDLLRDAVSGGAPPVAAIPVPDVPSAATAKGVIGEAGEGGSSQPTSSDSQEAGARRQGRSGRGTTKTPERTAAAKRRPRVASGVEAPTSSTSNPAPSSSPGAGEPTLADLLGGTTGFTHPQP